MAANPLIKKLGLRSGMSALVLNAPSGYIDSLGELPAGVTLTQRPEGQHEFVQLFVVNRLQFDELIQQAHQSVVYDGLLWLCYPKKSGKIASDLSRDSFWELMQDRGLRPVMQISIDETWSALRFRPAEKVGK